MWLRPGGGMVIKILLEALRLCFSVMLFADSVLIFLLQYGSPSAFALHIDVVLIVQSWML